MLHDLDSFLYKLRFLIFSVLVMVCLVLLAVLTSVIGSNSAFAMKAGSSSQVLDVSMAHSPNVVTAGIYTMTNAIGQATSGINTAANNTLSSTTKATTHFGTTIANGTGTSMAFVGRATGNSALFATRVMVSYVTFTSSIPLRALGGISHAPVLSTVISPGHNTPLPQIGDAPVSLASAVLPTTTASAAPLTAATSAPAVVPQWPIHGAITTLFGVPEPPYQPIHTGLDISDGTRRGTTPVKPYLPGKVIQVIHSRIKLGNEVIVDHGNGLTSVYGHLNSTSVQEGQEVDQNTTLGYEGTTGVSTGVHLHFEIRVNGVAKNPLNFIAGRP